ncbi:MAG: M14 family zinc carboxypeptidase, partial [Acidobacteriota bacterium]
LVYREFSERAHEGFQEHYPDVLRWLDSRPRRNFPRRLLRVPHPGIMPLSRRIHWIESGPRQGLIRAEVSGPDRIEVTAWKTPRLRIFLHDRLLDLDQPLEIWVNGQQGFAGRVGRSLRTALESARQGQPGQVWAASVDLVVPVGAQGDHAGRRLAEEMQPSHARGRLSFWEMYALRSLQERFPQLGLEGEEVELPAGVEGLPEQKAIRLTSVQDGPWAEAGLKAGDLLLDVDGEPFFSGGGLDNLYFWLLRELRGQPARFPLSLFRPGGSEQKSVTLQLGPYTKRSPPPAPRPQRPLIAFDHYHSVEEIESYLQAVTQRYSNLARLREIGRSRAGRPILAVEIHNPETGPDSEKPAFYLDGNIHGGEALSAEGALFFIHHLLSRYRQAPEIRQLVDQNAFYVVPLVNPDGRAISIDKPENHRWNIRPMDEDGDGRMDEDPPEDLDGDGRILRMRLADPQGRWKVSAADPRLMVRRNGSEPDGEGKYYRIFSEGLDNDGDGRFNEDRVGGVDLNRNFPANWHPAQFASGPYPLSEPESRALAEYITSHPNIAAVHTYHTSGGLLLRFPTLADQDWDFPESDLQDYRAIAEEGVPLTGYDNYAYEKKKIVDLMKPGHGVFNDWASSVFGVLAMTTEMWGHAIGQGQEALLEWNDRVLKGEGFIDWKPFEHPQLGKVELGGWDRWSISSPPESMIEAELERNNQWVLTFARRLPRLAISEAAAQPADRAGHFRIQAQVANRGWMPTATAYAAEVLKTARPVQVSLILGNAVLAEGEAEVSLGVLPGAREEGPVARALEWQVRTLDPGKPAFAEITARSEKAGAVRVRLDLISRR